MPTIKQNIIQSMKMESNPLVYLEYTPTRVINRFLKRKVRRKKQFCMGYVSHPYKATYRITTCRHLIANEFGEIPSKIEILAGLEVFARYEGVNKKLHSLLFEDVAIKVHEDELADVLFVEITHPDTYNFKLLNQACANCKKRFPGSIVYYFQHPKTRKYFKLFEGNISKKEIYITGITNEGDFFFMEDKPTKHHRTFSTIDTTQAVSIKGASGSPILSRLGEVVGIICAHDQLRGKGIYLSIEKIERLYGETKEYHQ